MLNRRQFIKMTCAMGALSPVGAHILRAQETASLAPEFEWMDTFSGFEMAHSVAFDALGALYVTEPGRYRVRKCELHRNAWTEDRLFALAKPRPGAAEGLLNFPTGLCVTQHGDLIVSDTNNGRLQLFSPAGEHVLTVGQLGAARGEFLMPAGLHYTACGEGGVLWVVDSRNHRVQRFELAYQNGKPAVVWTDELNMEDDVVPSSVLAHGVAGEEVIAVCQDGAQTLHEFERKQSDARQTRWLNRRDSGAVSAWAYYAAEAAAVVCHGAEFEWVHIDPASSATAWLPLILRLPAGKPFAARAIALGGYEQELFMACLDRIEGSIHVFRRKPV